MYLATRSELYRSGDRPDRWESVFSVPAGENEIQCAAARAGAMMVGTRQGIFSSSDRGRTWRKVFRAITPEKNDILSMDISGSNEIVAGTGKGVYLSGDSGARWNDISGSLKNKRVDCVVCGRKALYAASADGVFVKKAMAEDWERVLVNSDAGDMTGEEAAVAAEAGAEEETTDQPCIAASGARLYMARGRAVSYTDDDGKSWNAMPASGLAGSVNCILPSNESPVIYCATTRGVFEFLPEQMAWSEIWRGADRLMNVKSIAFDPAGENSIWAATGRGIYKLEPGNFPPEEPFDIEKARNAVSMIYDGEPAFVRLQQAALRFAEVDPDKIRKWRAQARLSALVPKVSFGIDKSTSNSYEIYTSATKEYVVNGPDDISKGFDVSVSWDIGRMIWSDDQTNIDVRSRLTTQLRNDILDDLRRAYYERKRLQFEMALSPPKDMRLRFEKELRIRELAQAIDDLTGNYLSENTKRQDPQTSDL
jgi:hypothetical protein